MSRMLFVNLPVHDLARSVAFFSDLGFAVNDQVTDDRATCLVVSEQACVMLLVQPFFDTFSLKGRADAHTTTGVILGVSASSRAEVDRLADRALELGGSPGTEPSDEGFMYGRSFHDLDGHAWEVIGMDPAAG
jgi:predicted lactoylglutathione lyase